MRPFGSLVPPWAPTGVDEHVLHTRIFDVHRRGYASPSGRHSEFSVLTSCDWVTVIALTENDEVLLVEQWRAGVQHVTIEVPGGMAEPGEDPASACLRELEEETGWSGGPIEIIGSVEPNPAFLSNRCHTGLVRGVIRKGDPHGDEEEELGLHMLPVWRIPGLIQEGWITHSLVVVAFWHLMTRKPALFQKPD